jgi:holo-[acyl-carrier protein] synthase
VPWEEDLILGLGVDISEVNRIEAAIARHGEAFLKRVFTPAEIAYCERHRNRFERYAGRFAAKEATMKALGTGWARGVRWVDIEVARLPTGKPTMALHGTTREHADRMGVRHIHVSITHSGNTAFAQVIFED